MKAKPSSILVENPGSELAAGERDRLLAMVAHELRTPLMPIVSGALVLQRHGTDPELVKATARVIERQGRLLGRLIDDLLDVSHARLGGIQLRRGRVSVLAIVESCAQTMAPYVSDRGLRMQIAIAPETMELHADATRLCQALQNLIANAAKFSNPGAILRVRAARDQDEAVIVVSDDGIGIDASALESIFTLYEQIGRTDSNHEGGLGIGLYLARQFVEAHGGSLTAASAGANRGSSFTIRVPCLDFYPEAAGFPRWSPSSRSVSALTTA